MDTAANFYKAARPEPPRCIGLQLRPYSLGHHVTLQSLDSSFLKGVPRFIDLVLGVFICSQTWADWQAWRDSWKFKVFLKVWGWTHRRFDVKAEGERFAQYIADGSRAPEVAVPANAKALASPWEIRIKLFLIRELRMTPEQAMDYPLSLAWQEYCAHSELQGSITLLSEADEVSLGAVGSDRIKGLVEEAKAAHMAEVAEMKSRAAAQQKEGN